MLGLRIPVLPPTEVISTKLRALTERYCDFGRTAAAGARGPGAARLAAAAPGIDDNPFAEAFLGLADRLGITGDRVETAPAEQLAVRPP